MLNRIRHINSDERFILLVSNDSALACRSESVESGTRRDCNLYFAVAFVYTEVVLRYKFTERRSVERGETRGEVFADESRNKERVGKKSDVHVGIEEVCLKNSVEQRNNCAVVKTFKALACCSGVRDCLLINLIVVEKSFAAVDSGVSNLLYEEVPTGNDSILIDVLNGLLKRELLHLFKLDEAKVIRHLERVDVDSLLRETGVYTRNVVSVVTNDVTEFVHDSRPVDRVIFYKVNKAAADVNGDVLCVCYKILRLIESLMKFCKSSGKECKVSILNHRVADKRRGNLRAVDVADGICFSAL